MKNIYEEQVFHLDLSKAECGTRNTEGGKMDELKRISKDLAINTIRFIENMNRSMTTRVIGNQLLRSSTSVGANYRAAIRSRSPADFIAKMGIVEEEADECMYWTELLVESGFISQDQARKIQDQANQIVAMAVSSIKTARSRIS
jgi:four helix bundle protein